MQAINNYNVVLINSTEDFLRFSHQWKEFEQTVNNLNLTTSFDNLFTWWEALKNIDNNQYGYKKQLRILLLFRNKELIAIAPFVKIYRTKYFFKLSYIEFLGQQWGGTYCDIIGNDLRKNEINCIFQWIYENEKFDILKLSYIPEYTKNFDIKSDDCFILSGCPVIDLQRFISFEEYQNETYSKNLKQNMRTAMNRMRNNHEFYEVEIIENINEEHFEIIKELSLSKLVDHKVKHSLYTNVEKSIFVKNMLSKCKHSLLIIKINDRPAAYRLNIIYSNIKYCLDASYDRSYPKYELGSISVDESIKDSFNKKYTLHSEGTGIDYYKLKFCKQICKIYTHIEKGNSILSSFVFPRIKAAIQYQENKFLEEISKFEI